MLKDTGILLIATGHPGYGKLAYNLAVTIKAIERVDITVITDGDGLNHLTEDQKEIFNSIILLPKEYRTGFGTKLHLDQLTPYNKTLCLDVDMTWLSKKPSELFAYLSGKSFATIMEGDSDKPNNKYYFWADAEEIKKVYAVEKIPQIRSEVLYFESGCNVFEKARTLKPQECLRTIRMFGHLVPDELYFNIACALLKIPLIPGWMPAYWPRLHGEIMPNLPVLHKDYYLLSFGSNVVSPVMKRTYDNVMMVAVRKLGLPYLFKLKSKKEWAPGRLKI
jgi:hypothetical protein